MYICTYTYLGNYSWWVSHVHNSCLMFVYLCYYLFTRKLVCFLSRVYDCARFEGGNKKIGTESLSPPSITTPTPPYSTLYVLRKYVHTGAAMYFDSQSKKDSWSEWKINMWPAVACVLLLAYLLRALLPLFDEVLTRFAQSRFCCRNYFFAIMRILSLTATSEFLNTGNKLFFSKKSLRKHCFKLTHSTIKVFSLRFFLHKINFPNINPNCGNLFKSVDFALLYLPCFFCGLLNWIIRWTNLDRIGDKILILLAHLE